MKKVAMASVLVLVSLWIVDARAASIPEGINYRTLRQSRELQVRPDVAKRTVTQSRSSREPAPLRETARAQSSSSTFSATPSVAVSSQSVSRAAPAPRRQSISSFAPASVGQLVLLESVPLEGGFRSSSSPIRGSAYRSIWGLQSGVSAERLSSRLKSGSSEELYSGMVKPSRVAFFDTSSPAFSKEGEVRRSEKGGEYIYTLFRDASSDLSLTRILQQTGETRRLCGWIVASPKIGRLKVLLTEGNSTFYVKVSTSEMRSGARVSVPINALFGDRLLTTSMTVQR